MRPSGLTAPCCFLSSWNRANRVHKTRSKVAPIHPFKSFPHPFISLCIAAVLTDVAGAGSRGTVSVQCGSAVHVMECSVRYCAMIQYVHTRSDEDLVPGDRSSCRCSIDPPTCRASTQVCSGRGCCGHRSLLCHVWLRCGAVMQVAAPVVEEGLEAGATGHPPPCECQLRKDCVIQRCKCTQS